MKVTAWLPAVGTRERLLVEVAVLPNCSQVWVGVRS